MTKLDIENNDFVALPEELLWNMTSLKHLIFGSLTYVYQQHAPCSVRVGVCVVWSISCAHALVNVCVVVVVCVCVCVCVVCVWVGGGGGGGLSRACGFSTCICTDVRPFFELAGN